MIQGFFKELSDSISFVFKKHLYLYFLPAIFISLIFYLSVKGGDGIVGWLSFMEDWWVIGWIIKSLESIISAVSFVLFEFFILVLLTPINSYFAEKVQEDITGIEAKFDMQQFVRSIGRSLKIFLVAFSTEMILLLIVWIFSFWAGSWFSTVVGFTVSSFFIGFSFYDFALDLDLQKSKASWQWGKSNFWLVLVTGLVFSVAIYIPERTGLTFLYIVAISIIPHLLTIASASTYFKSVKSKN